MINNSSKIIYDLLTSLLTWSRSQRGDISPNFESHNIANVLKENIKLAKVQADKKEIQITNGAYNNETKVDCDIDLINNVIRNLLNNAVKFTPIGGKVIVSFRKEKDVVIVSIKDNGVGISEENLGRLFKKRKHFTTFGTNNERGTGLGLTICKDFITIHNGEIWVTSKEGQGSEFCFSIPAQRK